MASSATANTAAATAPEAPTTAAANAAPTSKVDTPTILTMLHTLLRAHCQAHPSPTLPFLHPYAPLPPAPWKGKARAELPSAEGQLEALRALREVVDNSRNLLERRGEPQPDRVRLARAMREVVTHESALLPLGTTLASLPPTAATLDALVPLPPTELLPALCKRLGLDVFAEDSQFGLLRTSLTLAGSRFVVDVDLEMDAAEGDHTEPPTADGTPAGSTSLGMSLTPLTHALATTPAGKPASEAGKEKDDRGKVRLAKLTASHVTPSGEAGKSDHVAQVLRVLVEQHLSCWNAATAEGKAGLRSACAALESALAELKALDELAEASVNTDIDPFLDLETLAEGVDRATDSTALVRLYPDPKAGIYPSFRLLPGAADRRNPAFRLRPSGRGEHVPPPPEDSGAMAVDNYEEQQMCKGSWLLEVVDDNPSPSTGGRGIVVRRTWLQAGEDHDEAATSLASGIKAEGLLYQAALEEKGSQALPISLYTSVFTHPNEKMGQFWSLAAPGPDGYVVGRVGLPGTWREFGRLATALRAQLVLNAVFASAFDPTKAEVDNHGVANESLGLGIGEATSNGGEADDDISLADLEAAPTNLPLTASLHAGSFRVSFPFPSGAAEPPTITLELKAAAEPPYVTGTWDADPALETRDTLDAAVKAALEVEGPDAVDIVARVLCAL